MGIRTGTFWIVTGILCLNISWVLCHYPILYVEDQCISGRETITYDTSKWGSAGILKATAHPPYSGFKNCTIIIQPPPGLGIVLSVRKIDLSPKRQYFCTDYIKIFHADAFESPTMMCQFIFDLKEHRSYFSEGRMKILYHTSEKDLYNDDSLLEEGFTLTYTAVTYGESSCKGNEFTCNNGRCIDKTLVCDTRNNCGDRSDESHLVCDGDVFIGDNFRITDVFFVAILVLIGIVIIGTCFTMCFYQRRSKNSQSDSGQDTPTRLTPYQAIHPSGFFICQNPAGPPNLYQQSNLVQSDGGFANPCYPTGVPQAPPPPYKSN